MTTSFPTSQWCFSLIALFASAAAHADGAAINRVLQQNPIPENFAVCHGGGCASVEQVALDDDEWRQVASAFFPLPQDAQQERHCIADAIGSFERIVGAKTGTDTDRGGTFGNADFPGQLDCNDEAANTTTYMKLLRQAGLLRYHDIIDTKIRSFFFNGWPHTTAAIRERASGQRYAVDSWFYDNGAAAVILPLDVWKAGWKPGDSDAN